MDDENGQSGYYREIARAFLGRRGGALLLSPKDQAAIAAWEDQRIPLRVVLEGIVRTFEGLKARGRATKAVSLTFCDREVTAAFAQHRDRAAGRRKAQEAGPRSDKRDRARREIGQAVEALTPEDALVKRLLREALAALSDSPADEATLERLETEIEEALWSGAAAADKAEASADAAEGPRARRPAVSGEDLRRRVVMTERARRRIPHVSLHYY